jgi:hypothetical protein
MADEPKRATLARTLVNERRFGVLCTVSKRMPGYPFGSVSAYYVDPHGRPVLLMSAMSVHTKNLQESPHASLLVFAAEAEEDPMSAARVNLMGEVAPVPEEELPEVRAAYLEQYPAAQEWVDFGDMSFYRLTIQDVYYIGGFGVAGWVSKSDFAAA